MIIDQKTWAALPGRLRAQDERAQRLLWKWLREHACRILCQEQPGSYKQLALEDSLSKAFRIIVGKVEDGSYQGGNFSAFCTEVLKRSWWDEQKRHRRHRYTKLPESLPLAEAPARVHSVQELFQRIGQEHLLRWLQALRPQDRELLNLHFQGFPHTEIAEQLGLSYGSVRNRYSSLIREAGRLVRAA